MSGASVVMAGEARTSGPVGVVALDVVDDDAFELLLAPDDRGVEEFTADRAAPLPVGAERRG